MLFRSFSVFAGRRLAHFSVLLTLTTADEWAEWRTFKPLVDKLPTRRGGSGKDTGNLDIWHPHLEDLDIRAVGVAEVMQAVQTDDGWQIEIKFIEFRHPKLTLAKPEGATATPVDPIEEQVIKPLLAQVEELAAE